MMYFFGHAGIKTASKTISSTRNNTLEDSKLNDYYPFLKDGFLKDDCFKDEALANDNFDDEVELDRFIKLTTYSWTGFERLGVAIFTRSLFYNDISIRFRLSHGYGTISQFSQFSPIF